jgi:hypothetical protein
MLTNPTPKSDIQFGEASASWNTKYLTPDVFECQLTLRGENGSEVLEKSTAAIAFLLKSGCAPSASFRPTFSAKKLAATPAQNNSASKEPQQANNNGNNHNGHERNWCPIHECEMTKWEKGGRVWYSHKAGDQWCRGKPKRK